MIQSGGTRASSRRAWSFIVGSATAVAIATGSVASAAGWTAPGRVTNAGASYHPRALEAVVMDGANRIHALWSDGVDLQYGWKPAGAGWTFRTIDRGFRTEFGDVEAHDAAISVDGVTGKVYVAFARNDCLDVCESDSANRTYVITNAFGTHSDGTWKQIHEGALGDNDPAIRVAGGRIHLVFARAGVGIVYRSRPTTSGGTWSAAKTLATATKTSEIVDAASALRLDGQRDIHVAYQHTGANAAGEPAQAGIRYVEWRLPTSSSPWTLLRSRTITTTAAHHPNLELDRAGNAHAAFTRMAGSATGTYYRRLPTGSSAAWSSVQKASSAAWSASLTLDSNDIPALVVSDGDGVFYKKRRPDGTWPVGTQSGNFHLAPFGTDAIVEIDTANKAHVLFVNRTRRTVAGVVREPGTYYTRQN